MDLDEVDLVENLVIDLEADVADAEDALGEGDVEGLLVCDFPGCDFEDPNTKEMDEHRAEEHGLDPEEEWTAPHLVT